MLFWFKVFSSVSRFQRFQTLGLSPVTSREFHHGTRRTHGNQSLLFPWFLCSPWLEKPWDCPQLPAKNPTTEHAEHTETRAFFFRVFRVLRGEQNPGTVPSYKPRIQPQNTPNTRKPGPSFSVCSVYSVVKQKPRTLYSQRAGGYFMALLGDKLGG
jgi:hypothetical protein